MFRVLVPGGRVALSVYSAIENTPVAHALSVVQTIRFTSPREYVRLQDRATPMAGMVAGMESTKRETVIKAITDTLATSLGRNPGTEGLTSPQEGFVTLARRCP